MVGKKSLPANDLRNLITSRKANPGKALVSQPASAQLTSQLLLNGGQSGEVGRDQTEWRPWLYHFLMVPTIVGCCVVFGVAVVYHLDGLCNISDCIDRVPYRRAPIVLAAFAILVKSLERLWHKLRPRLHLRRPA
jgi:hypothetical protein